MKQFNTLVEAAQLAITLANDWQFALSDERYEKHELLILADTSDSENPLDEDCFYVVSSNGAIGFLEEGEAVDWLFLPDTLGG